MAEQLIRVTSWKEYCDLQNKIDVDEEVQYLQRN